MDLQNYLPCAVEFLGNLAQEVKNYDCLCLLSVDDCPEVGEELKNCAKYDAAFEKEISCLWSKTLGVRIVYSPVGKLSDYEDVRKYGVAAGKAIARARKAGSNRPVIVLPRNSDIKHAQLITLLGAFEELYLPIQYREEVAKLEKMSCLGVFNPAGKSFTLDLAKQIEVSRYVARDIGVGDPERMAPPRVAEYVQQFLKKMPSKLTCNIISDPVLLVKEYPLFSAVNRAAHSVERHRGQLIFLEYVPPQKARKTLMLVGKGVTYDTGGADIKAGGVMAGMSRDKCGAAAVAGFMALVAQRAPADVHVVAAMCMVRNSVGEECYVSDEVITSRAGVRVRVGNTDAEGRMAMADALCRMKELAVQSKYPDPHLYTIATLTGHACLAVGEGYTIVMDNGPARAAGHGLRLKETGDEIGEPFEISTLRPEDFRFHSGKVKGEDVMQANNLPSSRTPRGHQGPAAFMILATGLDKHGTKSDLPLKYSHLDIAASAGEYPEMPTGAPVLALAKLHLNL
ncbi:putative aminopeptidase W07G4.4 [Phlebotomus argentipes]|uniref:putative aminopeptidase W07G4.4 n=1 Tax=Phlebotomus argentipes TaxID=94469 RepID=UPI0028931342|nr:putative aminopeptidase W07G4.4 [Phlebotomus argentipes]